MFGLQGESGARSGDGNGNGNPEDLVHQMAAVNVRVLTCPWPPSRFPLTDDWPEIGVRGLGIGGPSLKRIANATANGEASASCLKHFA